MSRRNIHVTSQPQGYRDVWWCGRINEPYIDAKNGCEHCGESDLRTRHQFICHIQKGGEPEPELVILANVIKGTDDAEAEIKILRDAIDGFGQQVHQAYHGAQEPDLNDVNHVECSRGLCRSVQHVLDGKRPRGMP